MFGFTEICKIEDKKIYTDFNDRNVFVDAFFVLPELFCFKYCDSVYYISLCFVD